MTTNNSKKSRMWTTTGTCSSQTITIVLKLCEACNKRYYEESMGECDYCWDYYNDNKFFRCDSPDFIRRRWLRICYKLRIPYKLIRFFWRRDVD